MTTADPTRGIGDPAGLPDDGTSAIAKVGALVFFGMMTAYYVFKPIRDSLAIDLGATVVPYLKLLGLATLIVANMLYSWLAARFPRERFITWIIRFFVVCLVIFWFIFHATLTTLPSAPPDVATLASGTVSLAPSPQLPVGSKPDPFSFLGLMITGFYAWVGVFSLFTVSLFWSLINDVCSVAEGRRHYALIGSGGLAGSLIGGVLTTGLVERVGTANLLLVSALILELTVWGMRLIHRWDCARSPERRDRAVRAPARSTSVNEAVASMRASPYLRLMVAEMFFCTLACGLYDFLVASFTEHAIQDRDERTRFISMVYNVVGVLSLLFQATLTRWLLGSRWIGLGVTLTPIIQGASCLMLMGLPTLAVAVGGMVLRSSLGYGTSRAVREVFFTPLDRDAKYRAKGLIDTIVFRTGDGLASLLLVGGNMAMKGLPGERIWSVFPTLIVVVLWWSAARRLVAGFSDLTNGAAISTALHGPDDPANLDTKAVAAGSTEQRS